MDFLGENGLTRLWEHVTSKLATKVNKVNGMGLSSNDYTAEDKEKLLNVEYGAQVNTITSVNGKTGDVVLTADDLGDTSSSMTLDLAKAYTDEVGLTKADIGHVHIASDITDLETSLDTRVPTNRTINGKELLEDIVLVASDVGADEVGSAESALINAKSYTDELVATKSEIGHTHDDMYYTEGEIDNKVAEINTSVSNIIDGTVTVAKANNALTSDFANTSETATKATMDDDGNSIKETYETKTDSASKLNEAKSYADGVKNDLLNGAGDAYDTLKELGELIDDNHDAIDALEVVASGKADKVHGHVIDDVTDLQNVLDGKASLDIATSKTNGLMSFDDKLKLDELVVANVIYAQNEEPIDAVDGDVWCDLDAPSIEILNGYTPARGVDYWTEDDKSEIIQDILESLPTWEGGSY